MRLRLLCAGLAIWAGVSLAVPAQKPARKSAAGKAPAPAAAQSEEDALEQALREAGSSQVEYTRALERHLKRFPSSDKKDEILRVLAQNALEQRDSKRVLLYGLPVIASGSKNIALHDAACRALLQRSAEGDAARALGLARKMSELIEEQQKTLEEEKGFSAARARRLDDLRSAAAKSALYEGRAFRQMGDTAGARTALDRSWSIFALEDTARERSALLEQTGEKMGAAEAFADAVATGGLDLTDPADRLRLTKLAGDLAGRLLIEAWARSEQRNREREARLKAVDPNFGAKEILDYTLSSVEGPPLRLKSLLGKVVVIDFWATWCGPCRAQHPLYEQVKRRFAGRDDVVFLAVSTDENRNSVAPFLESMGWSKSVYYEDGLASSQRISSIPTTMVLDREGGVASRLHGFAADTFVDILTARIKAALGEPE